MRRRFLTMTQVVARMKRGELPVSMGGYSDACVFDDGGRVKHQTMNQLIKRGVVDRPVGTCVMNPFTLTKNSN